MALLRVKEGPAKNTEFRLRQDPVRIGRARTCTLRIAGDRISREHAEIAPGDGGFVLTDLKSSNGTFVNGERIETRTLEHGDEIAVGDVVFIFLPDDAPRPEEAEPEELSVAEAAEAMEQAVAAAAPGAEAPAEAAVPEAQSVEAPEEAPLAEKAAAPAVQTAPKTKRGVDARMVASMKRATNAIRAEVGKIIVGQDQVLSEVLAAMLARGHCLMVGVPGLAKTLMVRTIAQILDLSFHRVQFTPDLMPSDITGTDILEVDENTGAKSFRFIKGPIFTHMLLADEINRTPPKTQAALLEAMQERSVTASGYTYKLDEPFFVLATQNPLEQEGTYPLPEAQLDRFMFNILVDYPSETEEELIVKRTTFRAMPTPRKILRGSDIVLLQKIVWRVPVSDHVIKYACALVRASRPGDEHIPEFVNERVLCGAGPRACQYLILGAKARAVIDGRTQPTVEDVRAVAVPVMRHRIFVNFNALSEGVSPTDIVRELVKATPAPMDRSPITRGYQPSAPRGKPDLSLPRLAEGEKLNLEAIQRMRDASARIRDEAQKVIIGQTEVLDQILMAMIARGHCLMVGVPGLAKTLMVRTIASVLDLNFRRIQFTPDLMPSDITGTDILEEDERTGEKTFRFIRGPIFTNILLADEINRTPPKTQAALLEAMQEYSVTASGTTYQLDLPFFVLATQNPLEQEGTYPLPEAQLDRFMFNIWVDYPTEPEEQSIVKETTRLQHAEPEVVLGGEHILALQDIVRRVPVSDHVIKYATRLVRTTRPETTGAPKFIHDWVYCGAGPRACQYLILGAKARAVLDGRANVSCNDVRAAALPVMRHRIFTNFNADSEGITTVEIIERLLAEVPEPGEKDYAPAPRKAAPAARRKPEAAVAFTAEPKKAGGKAIEVAPEAAAAIKPARAPEQRVAEGEWVEEPAADDIPEAEWVDAPERGDSKGPAKRRPPRTR